MLAFTQAAQTVAQRGAPEDGGASNAAAATAAATIRAIKRSPDFHRAGRTPAPRRSHVAWGAARRQSPAASVLDLKFASFWIDL
jgi:hypothetical protein